jgi:phosphoglycolate phosphatase-like HAD superfamily hydrolase
VSCALLWDIDGTLLTTARAGVFALEDAARTLYGSERSLQEMKTSGMTDPEIAAVVIREAGGDPTRDEVKRFLRLYGEALPERLHMRQGRVLPNVREILAAFHERPDVHNLLLTGNTSAGARAKLRHYGIADYFDGGAFSDEVFDRPGIGRIALEQARERIAHDSGNGRVFLIGDTPKDVQAGHAIGVPVVAVGGTYACEELEAERPWKVLEQLPEPSEFAALLGID